MRWFRQFRELSRERPFLAAGAIAVVFRVLALLRDNPPNGRRHIRMLEDHGEGLKCERADHARQAIHEERGRIARELHDVIAHDMSVMVVQAGAARRVLEARPEEARSAMATIESIGRQSLDEMRRLLGVLGKEDESSNGRVPQPSLAHLNVLVERCRGAGLLVNFVTEGDPRPLAPGIDLSAYRIVQAALSNALKHAGRAKVSLRLCYADDVVEVRVTGDGGGVADDPDASALDFGLVAMRERVKLYDGEFHVDNQPGGGFAVRARLPLKAVHS